MLKSIENNLIFLKQAFYTFLNASLEINDGIALGDENIILTAVSLFLLKFYSIQIAKKMFFDRLLIAGSTWFGVKVVVRACKALKKISLKRNFDKILKCLKIAIDLL